MKTYEGFILTVCDGLYYPEWIEGTEEKSGFDIKKELVIDFCSEYLNIKDSEKLAVFIEENKGVQLINAFDREIQEAVDGMIDISYCGMYTSCGRFSDYTNEAIEDGLCTGETNLFDILRWGQHLAYTKFFSEVVESIQKYIDELEEEEEDETL